MYDEVKRHLNGLLGAKVIRPSFSLWCSNIVLVRKRDSSLRMCVDFRHLNNATIPDAYIIPRIEDILDELSGMSYYTVLDMKSGYHQVEIIEEHKNRTVFTVGPMELFEFNRLPFGLLNAPATYQRFMADCLGDLNHRICEIYLDDVIIYSKTRSEHFCKLELFPRFWHCGFKLSHKNVICFVPRWDM